MINQPATVGAPFLFGLFMPEILSAHLRSRPPLSNTHSSPSTKVTILSPSSGLCPIKDSACLRFHSNINPAILSLIKPAGTKDINGFRDFACPRIFALMQQRPPRGHAEAQHILAMEHRHLRLNLCNLLKCINRCGARVQPLGAFPLPLWRPLG